MSERLKFQGRLVEKQQESKSLQLRMEGLRDSIREILDPFESVENLNVDIATEQVFELARLHIDYMRTLAEITAIKKALGK